MADLIDRGELRKDFCNMCEAMQPEMIDCEKKGCMSMQIIDEQPAVDRWIPCSERLPEKHVEVLAYSPYWRKIVVAMWGGEFWLEQWTDDDLEKSEISHWMPMPEPPKGGAEDENKG